MNILFHIGHPGHVHHFKFVIKKLKEKGNDILITAKEKEMSFYLLKKYNIPFTKLTKNRKGLLYKFIDLFSDEKKIYEICNEFKPDVIVSRGSPSSAHVSGLLSIPYLCFSDTEHAKLIWYLTKPFASKIITPSCFKLDFGKKHILYNGYVELAYLHPNYFTPDPSVLNLLNVEKGEEFIIIRFVSWEASHDIGHSGLSFEMIRKVVKEFSKYAKIFITSEGLLPKDLDKNRIRIPHERIHDALYYASLYFGDGGTME